MSGSRLIYTFGFILIFILICINSPQRSYGDRVNRDTFNRRKAPEKMRTDNSQEAPDGEEFTPPETPKKTIKIENFIRKFFRPKKKKSAAKMVPERDRSRVYEDDAESPRRDDAKGNDDDSLLTPDEKDIDKKLKEHMETVNRDRLWMKRQAEEKYQEGLKFYEGGMYPRAKQSFTDALNFDPAHEQARIFLNRTRRQLNEDVMPSKEEIGDRVRIEIMKAQQERKEIIYDFGKAESKYENAVKMPASRLDDSIKEFKEILGILATVRARLDARPMTERMEDIERRVYALRDRVTEEIAARERQIEQANIKKAEAIFDETRKTKMKWEQERINTLLKDIKIYEKNAEWDKAVEAVNQLIRYQPNKRSWQKKLENLERKRSDYVMNKTAIVREQEIKRTFELLDDARIPHSKLFTLPTDWNERTKKSKPGEDDEAAAKNQEEEWIKNIKNKMLKLTPIRFEDAELPDVIQFLSQMANVNIILHPGARLMEDGSPRLVTLNVPNMSLQSALEWIILFQRDLAFEYRDDAILVDLKTNIEGKYITKTYDIRDLVFQIRHFVAPRIDLEPGADALAIEAAPEAAAVPDDELILRLQEIIRAQEPDSWADPRASILQHLSVLIITQTKAVHILIQHVLDRLRQSALLMVALESRYVEVEDSFLESIGVTWVPDASGMPGYRGNFGTGQTTDGGTVYNRAYRYYQLASTFAKPWRVFSDDLMRNQNDTGLTLNYQLIGDSFAEFILNVIKMKKRGSVLFAPRITVMNTQRAFIQVVTQEAYVRGYGGAVDAGAVPEIDIQDFSLGVVLEVKPVVSADRRFITIEMLPTTAVLGEKGLQDRTFVFGNVIYQIQFPQIVLRRIRTTVIVPNGGTILMGGLMDDIENSFESGIPFLSKIPVLGFLFRQKEQQRRKRQLLIFVKAKVISYSDDEPDFVSAGS